MALPDPLAALSDYYDLVSTGWGCSKDDPTDSELQAWFQSMNRRAREDGLSISCKNVWDGPHFRSTHGVAFLQMRDGARPPEDPAYYNPWGTAEQRRAALIARLEAEWGETLLFARARVISELDTAAPNWRIDHVRHD